MAAWSLVLKARSPSRMRVLTFCTACIASIARASPEPVEAPAGIAERTATLLPGLLLARVDGKSPVEYLTDERDKDRLRKFGRHYLHHPVPSLTVLKEEWQRSLT